MTVEQATDVKVTRGTNFSSANIGPFSKLDAYRLEVPAFKRDVRGKLFIKEMLDFTGMQISMNKLPAGASSPFYHQHKENEEAYIFVGGTGQIQIDGQTLPVEEGTIVRINTNGSRALRNTGSGDLYYICVQAKQGSLNQDTFEDGIKSDTPVVW